MCSSGVFRLNYACAEVFSPSCLQGLLAEQQLHRQQDHGVNCVEQAVFLMHAAPSYTQPLFGGNARKNKLWPQFNLPRPHSLQVGFYLDSISEIKELPCQASVQREILPCNVPKWDRKNICKKYILVSALPTAKAKSQIFHDVISQRSWFSGQNLTSSVLKKLQWSCTGESGLLCVTCYNIFVYFVLYFSIVLLNNLQDNFLQRKLLLGFISMTLGYLSQFNLHKLRNQVLPVVASPSIHSIVQYNFQFSQAIWQLWSISHCML